MSTHSEGPVWSVHFQKYLHKIWEVQYQRYYWTHYVGMLKAFIMSIAATNILQKDKGGFFSVGVLWTNMGMLHSRQNLGNSFPFVPCNDEMLFLVPVHSEFIDHLCLPLQKDRPPGDHKMLQGLAKTAQTLDFLYLMPVPLLSKLPVGLDAAVVLPTLRPSPLHLSPLHLLLQHLLLLYMSLLRLSPINLSQAPGQAPWRIHKLLLAQKRRQFKQNVAIQGTREDLLHCLQCNLH